MKNTKNISKSVMGRVMFLLVLLFIFAYSVPSALAVSVEKGNFIVLGRHVGAKDKKSDLVQEKVKLYSSPGIEDAVPASLDSGTVVLVLEKANIKKAGIFYEITTIGREGGTIGWVLEDCIYKVVPEPEME
jgi:hypothetical protein